MKKKLTRPQIRNILLGAERVFFRAMLDGYVGGESQKSSIIKTSDGYTTIRFFDGDYQVVDRYCVTPHSDCSAGTTTIFFKNEPVWWMSYHGSYPAEVIPFLKDVLLETYKGRLFIGGRGLRCLSNGTLEYLNNVRTESFNSFSGREEICRLTPKVIKVGGQKERVISHTLLGYHEYSGLALI